MDYALIEQQTRALLGGLAEVGRLRPGTVLVIGCSTSEIAGERIGTAGSEAVAAAVFAAVRKGQDEIGFRPAFQCCEHLNRALVVERGLMEERDLEEVSVVPVPRAGGAMAAFAFREAKDPVVVAHLRAEAGIDIGGTLIGMHVKHVAVPVKCAVRQIGAAHVTAAGHRPPLIGGPRAVYELPGR
ncbi:MAG: hypothetical protein QG622_2790 [Actinomycetota bacterium]|nr:hypothetical protein [Actinomycetota bacterium]